MEFDPNPMPPPPSSSRGPIRDALAWVVDRFDGWFLKWLHNRE